MAKKTQSSSQTEQVHQSDHSPLDFETTLSEVETIVRQLESGELTLDESLSVYESAVGKMKRCYQHLESVERKISVLSGFDAEGNPVLEDAHDSLPGQRAR